MNLDKLQLLQVSEESLKKFDIQAKNKSELIQQINDSIFRKCARTVKEKFDVLDLRDKVLKLIRYEINQTSSQQSIILIGTCQDMCPEKERYSREHLNLMSGYEILNGQIEHGLMVKEYSRSSADQDLPLPNELRPVNVMFETMLYIVDEVIAKIEAKNGWLDETTTGDWYDFAWNRTRAIRKEINQTRLLLNEHRLEEGADFQEHPNEFIRNGLGGVTIIEQCARFHILCSYRLSDQSPRVFSFKINEDNIKNCFQSLRQYYTSSALDSSHLTPSPHESEFRSYVILLNLSQSDILSEILSWSPLIRNSPHVKFALAIYNAFNSRNYVRFFRLMKSNECSYLQACILHRYVSKMRSIAFKTIFTAFKDGKEKAYPASKLADLLGFDTPDDVYDYTDVFELDSDETNVIMRSTSSYKCFDMSKENEERLKVRRSKLLVEGKFKRNSSLTDKKCLSQIIRGEYVGNQPSCFGADYSLSTVFDEDDYYCDTEINDLLEHVKPKELVGLKSSGVGASLKSKTALTPKIAVKKAATLVKKAIGVKINKPDGETKAEALSSKRRTSASSGSSTSSVGLRRKNSETGNKFAAAIKAKAAPEAAAPLFTAIAKSEGDKTNPFSRLVAGKVDNLATAIPKQTFWQSQITSVPMPAKEAPKNLFEHLINKHDQQDEAQRKEKQLNLKTESFFQSLLLEISKDIVLEVYQAHQTLVHLVFDVTDHFISSFIGAEVRAIYNEIVPVVKSDEQAERMQKQMELQRKQESYLRMQREMFFSNEILDSLTSEMIKEECTTFLRTCCELERAIYDDLLCSVFQNEFDIILKTIAQEINHELTVDHLIKCVYFNNGHEITANSKIDFNSIFMTDLCSIMHDCVHEATRLNLNVNRELYYEIKQALILNEKKHLFRKWRLKLSLRLLKSAHRRASLDNSKRTQNPKQLTPTKLSQTNLMDRQLNLITFIKAYGSFMLSNLDRLQRVLTFMVRDETAENVDECLNQSIGSQYSIVHSEEYQMHLAWNINMNYRHFLYEILLENYFDIIHNRRDQVLLPVHVSQELFVKISVAMPKLNTSEMDDMEAIKSWLLTKFFEPGQTSGVENLCVTQLHSNAYGLRFCAKLCTTGLTQAEFELKLNKREFYGTNALIFVLLPVEENEESFSYLRRMKGHFYQTLRLCNENLDLSNPNVIDLYQFMFVSYLESHEQTKEAIQFILGKSNCCYCLLDGDVTKDNGILQLTFQHFLKQVYKQTSKSSHSASPKKEVDSPPKINNNFEPINNVLTLANIYEMSLVNFFEYLAHSMKVIYLPFNAIIDEYNSRLEMLVRMLTRDEYRQLAWPIPELCTTELNSQSWILKYWNTRECFDNMIQGQFYNLMHLDIDLDMGECVCSDDGEGEQVDFSLVESKFNKYLEKLLSAKRSAGLLPFSQSECTKSKYQLDSSINNTIINMKKKLNVNNSHTISKYDIQWTQLILAAIEYLLANGYLRFKNTKRLNLEQFPFYCNLNEIKSYDWINNAQNGQGSIHSSPSSSVFSNQSDNQNHSLSKTANKSNYLANKYARQIESSFKQTKRRISDEEAAETSCDNPSLSSPLDQTSLEETYHLGEMFLSSFDKRPKSQRLMSPPHLQSGQVAEESPSFDARFEEFLSLMNTEKDKNEQFESKLTTCESNLHTSLDFLEARKQRRQDHALNEQQINKPGDSSDPTKQLDALLDRLKEEKIKNEQFNSKLDSMLNF